MTTYRPRHILMWPRGTRLTSMIKYSRGNCIPWNVTYAMNMSKHFLNKNHLIIVYYSLIHPHLTYGLRLWGNALQKYITKLEILQKKAVRAITCSKYNTPSSPLFKQLNILKLKDLHELQVEILIYDFVNQRLPDPLLELYSYHGDSHDHEQGTSLISSHLRQTRNLCDVVSYIRNLFYGYH